jgi:polyhydroxyalkanoate synthesis regulator phasin
MLFRDFIQIESESLKISNHPIKKSKLTNKDYHARSKQLTSDLFGKSKKKDFDLDEKDLMDMMTLYDKFTMVLKDEAERKEVAEELTEHMKEVLTDLKINTKNLKHPSLKELHHLKAKYTLCDVSKWRNKIT